MVKYIPQILRTALVMGEGSGCTTRFLVEAQYPEWNELVKGASSGSTYSRTDYLTALGHETGGSTRVLGVFRGEELIGGVAFLEHSGRFGRAASNRHLLHYNGIVVKSRVSKYPSDQGARELEVVDAVVTALKNEPFDYIALNNQSGVTDFRPCLSMRDWTIVPSYSYVVSLKDISFAWERVDKNLRRLIRRAEEAGMTITEDEDFESFFTLHAEVHDRKGAPIYLPKENFRRFYSTLAAAKLAKIFHARDLEGRSLASQLVLVGHPLRSHTVCAGSAKEGLSIGSTPFLRWKAFEILAKLGFSENDLTDASLNSVSRFKSELGAELRMNIVLSRRPSLRWRIGELINRLRS